MNRKQKQKPILLRDTRGNESFALRIEYPTKDYQPPRSKKKVEKNYTKGASKCV